MIVIGSNPNIPLPEVVEQLDKERLNFRSLLNEAKIYIGHDLIRNPEAISTWICSDHCLKCRILESLP